MKILLTKGPTNPTKDDSTEMCYNIDLDAH